jgi:hypothetical protein
VPLEGTHISDASDRLRPLRNGTSALVQPIKNVRATVGLADAIVTAGYRSGQTDLAGEQYRTVSSALDRLVHDLVQPATLYWQAPTEPIVRLGVAGTSAVGLP